MKFTAMKAAAAMCLLAPVMAMVKVPNPAATTFSYSFSDVADTNVKIGKNATGFLTIQASWTDLLSGFSSMVETQASPLSWSLTGPDGQTIFQQGVLADVAGDQNNGLIVLNERHVSLGASTFSASNPVSPVPEPASYFMLLAGLGLMGSIALRRKKSDVS